MTASRPIRVRGGLNIDLAGAPGTTLTDAGASSVIAVYPSDFLPMRPRIKVKEGDSVARGSVLFEDKKHPAFKVRSPAGGTISSVVIGERRMPDRIEVTTSPDERIERFPSFSLSQIARLTREEILGRLMDTGYLCFIRQRPFSHTANPECVPKAIFVNAMATAPFQVDINTAVAGSEDAFQAGLGILTRLTSGRVHLCLPHGRPLSPALTGAKDVDIHFFSGLHPAGNTSVHIFHINPIKPGDLIWTVSAADLILIGRLFLEGALPADRVIALGGPGVVPGANAHYRMRMGGCVQAFLESRLRAGEQRVVGGDVLSARICDPSGFLRFRQSSFTIIPEGRERHLLGWLMPGLKAFSAGRTHLSSWLPRRAECELDSNKRGAARPMVMTGLYDRYLPMKINVDFLARAVLAHDVEEAVKLGLLETEPEDFALCSFVCPSKTDFVSIIRQGLREVENEGI